ncbi:MerR family transcriptional regulator [Oceaniglobus ichthyenteri]|uniref:MerR family transcriptional regulator n=1 Tax=Oceaniglobus ichthyenteri TaxID=2136177 RepID=UPI000D3538E6|nr:MerR family transcriptional regulator [Oceaniglobus ichthyenteri]
MDTKSPDAFRTISEVAEWLDVPTHVLRFWESRFTQVKPVKRAGGRRYYRPADMELLGGIKRLLHDDGLTIRGVQKLLREEGVKHVASLSPGIDGSAAPATKAAANTVHAPEGPMAVDVPVIPQLGEVVNFAPDTEPAPKIAPDTSEESLNRWPFIDDPEEPAPDPAKTSQADTKPDITPDSTQQAASKPDVITLLRATPPERLKPRADTLRPLIERMAALHNRMAEAD